jgi:hypothetical protein
LSWERRLLDSRPGLRDQVLADSAFIQWRMSLPVVEVDGEEFTVIHGDRLVDLDQLILEWVHRFRPKLLGGTDGNSESEDSS